MPPEEGPMRKLITILAITALLGGASVMTGCSGICGTCGFKPCQCYK